MRRMAALRVEMRSRSARTSRASWDSVKAPPPPDRHESRSNAAATEAPRCLIYEYTMLCPVFHMHISHRSAYAHVLIRRRCSPRRRRWRRDQPPSGAVQSWGEACDAAVATGGSAIPRSTTGSTPDAERWPLPGRSHQPRFSGFPVRPAGTDASRHALARQSARLAFALALLLAPRKAAGAVPRGAHPRAVRR